MKETLKPTNRHSVLERVKVVCNENGVTYSVPCDRQVIDLSNGMRADIHWLDGNNNGCLTRFSKKLRYITPVIWITHKIDQSWYMRFNISGDYPQLTGVFYALLKSNPDFQDIQPVIVERKNHEAGKEVCHAY